MRKTKSARAVPAADGGQLTCWPDREALSEAVSAQRAGELLGVATKTLANWRASVIGPPFIKYGGRNGPVRYVLGELLAWREAQRRARD